MRMAACSPGYGCPLCRIAPVYRMLVKQSPQRIQRKRAARGELTRLKGPALEPPAPPLDLRQRPPGRTMLLEQRKDRPHAFGLFLVHYQPSTARVHVIAQHRAPAYPFPLPPGCRHLVPRAFTDQLPLKLSEAEKNIQRQPPERRAGVELLGHGHETHVVLLEEAQ